MTEDTMAEAQRKPTTMTVADFLDWPGDGSGRRFQLIDGELRAMSPASPIHSAIQTNLAYELRRHFLERKSECRALTEPAVATRVRANINLRVPDLGVTCIPDAPDHRTMPDPILLIEILSPGNTSDTWDNVWSYTTIPSVREIAVVHSTRVLVELLRRGADGSWPAEPEEIGPGASLRFDSIGFACPLAEVYAQTHLA
jgi:Uma2 family endonuclease